MSEEKTVEATDTTPQSDKKATSKKKIKRYNKEDVANEIKRLRRLNQTGSVYYRHVEARAKELSVVV